MRVLARLLLYKLLLASASCSYQDETADDVTSRLGLNRWLITWGHAPPEVNIASRKGAQMAYEEMFNFYFIHLKKMLYFYPGSV